jgi:pimeloyl-ACP methyl ester carboxylesterase
MPFAYNYGVRIFYKVVGDGSPLVLHHGLGGTHEEWSRAGYVETLKGKYRFILMDARGRGKSDKPHGPEKHSMEFMVGDVVAVLDDLGIEKAHFWGYSMGGRVALAAGRYAPDRFSSLIIGGNGLSEKDSKEEMEELQGYIRTFEQGVDAVIASIEKGRGREMEKWERDKWLNDDLDALIAYCSNYENIGMAEYLPTLTIPCLFYAGEEDTYPHSRAKACAEIMQNALFMSLPGLDHEGAFNSWDQVLPHVLQFLERIE